jgi:hypothetical protein
MFGSGRFCLFEQAAGFEFDDRYCPFFSHLNSIYTKLFKVTVSWRGMRKACPSKCQEKFA